MIHRILEDKVQALIGGKAILIMGARASRKQE